jgi:hypothetical protein
VETRGQSWTHAQALSAGLKGSATAGNGLSQRAFCCLGVRCCVAAPKAPGTFRFARAQVRARELFQRLNTSFAQLCNSQPSLVLRRREAASKDAPVPSRRGLADHPSRREASPRPQDKAAVRDAIIGQLRSRATCAAQRRGSFRFGRGGGQKQRKRNELFRRTKPTVSRPGSQVVEIIGVRNQGISPDCLFFKDLTALSFRALVACALSIPKGRVFGGPDRTSALTIGAS